MLGRKLVLLLAGGALAAALAPVPASGALVVPEEAQVNDPFGDGNFLNDQGFGGTGATVNGNTAAVPDVDDNVTGDDLTAAADIGKVWFSLTEEKVSVHIQTEAAPPSDEGVYYRAYATPGEGSAASTTLGCLRFYAVVPGSGPGGGTYQGPPWVRFHDYCNVGTNHFTHSVDAELAVEELEDGTGVVTISADRSLSPFLQGEKVAITQPSAESLVATGGAAAGVQVLQNYPRYDTTKAGTDVDLVVGGGGPTPVCPGFENVKGNLLLGTSEADELHGTAGRDIICGLEGDDVLYGYDGKDIILGGAGLDEVHGGDDRDRLQGGDDNDNITGGSGRDKLNGGAGDDKLNGGFGNDRLNGSTGKDVCTSGGGRDRRKACEQR